MDGIPVLTGLSLNVADASSSAYSVITAWARRRSCSTLIGILPATAGEIQFHGASITEAPPHRRARIGIGYVPQGRGIFPGLTVRDNLRFAAVAVGAQPDDLP